ncbi:hypothetical protein [Arthrobacter bambusae]|uniref:hypothetical protein n=1 Tax=Arthrobacter bambusae TaxID=1338426 RepID=UPI002781D395|nr:hypothetical protein [Arthrobacter bambusae]MDQ0028428.1 multisubunit Na+/H+ antiporter MnhE subunit [Arthrobacter bambusae]MDQ0096777.1 multisubunit Na+/H+ antiporter MnhE subunit [Arthrobacter bambusae]
MQRARSVSAASDRTGRFRGFFGLPGTRGVSGALLELVLWWLAGTLSWLVTASTVTVPETVAAASTALFGAVLARMARRAMGFQAAARVIWLRWAALVPAAAVSDSVRLARWLAGPRRESLGEQQMPGTRSPKATGWRAGAMIALSSTPGSVVFYSDPDSNRLRVHVLAQGWPRLDRHVASGDG